MPIVPGAARLKPYFSIIGHSPDVVEIRSGGWNATSFTLQDDHQGGQLYSIVSGLDGSANPGELSRRLGVTRAQVEAVIDQLSALGVLETGPGTSLDYFIDQLASGEMRSPSDRKQRVVIVGEEDMANDLSQVLREAVPLAMVSCFSPSSPPFGDLRREIVSVSSDALSRQKLVSQFSSLDATMLVYLTSQIHPVLFQELDSICRELGICWMHAAIDGPLILVGPIFEPDKLGCYSCFEARVAMNLRGSASYERYKAALCAAKVHTRTGEVFAPIKRILVAHAALELTDYILTGSSQTVRKVLTFYMPTKEVAYQRVLSVTGCQTCGQLAGRDDSELHFRVSSLVERLK